MASNDFNHNYCDSSGVIIEPYNVSNEINWLSELGTSNTPRVLEVPKIIKTLDDAVCFINKSDRRNFIIRITEGGYYTLTAKLKCSLDSLTISACSHDLSGAGFFHQQIRLYDGCRPVNSNFLGQGQYTLTLSGKKIIVQTENIRGDKISRNPCFSEIQYGTTIRWFNRDGSVSEHNIYSGRKNTLCLCTPIEHDGPVVLGEGFIILPRVTINASNDKHKDKLYEFQTVDKLSFIGINWCSYISCRSSTEITQCLLDTDGKMIIRGHLVSNSVNSWLGPLTIYGHCELKYQLFSQSYGQLIGTQTTGRCINSNWISCWIGGLITSGSNLDFTAGQFITCLSGLQIDASVANITSCWWLGGEQGIAGTNNSRIVSSSTNDNDPPAFLGLGKGIVVSFNTISITPGVQLRNISNTSPSLSPDDFIVDDISFNVDSGGYINRQYGSINPSPGQSGFSYIQYN